jgi:hypothetical protein
MEVQESIRKEFGILKKQVEWILEKFPDSRNCDFYLIWLWLKYFSGINAFSSIWLEYKDISKVAGKLESLTRARRKIQEKGRFLPTDPKIIEKRRKKQEAMRKIMVGE